jgi:hypothetical protein
LTLDLADGEALQMADSSDEILDSEFVMRRVPVNASWYDPFMGLIAEAFKPHKTDDKDGLSVSRMRSEKSPEFLTPAMLAQAGRSPAGYYFAIVSVRALRETGMEIVADPKPEDRGHCLIVCLRTDNRKSVEVAQWMQMLAERLTIRVEGPFLKSLDTQ